MPVSPARAAALEILLRIETTDAYASEMLHASRFAKLSPADRGLLTELVMGVLRWRGVLDEKIASRSSQGLAKLDLEVLTALRLGAYQILFLDRVPWHAAVNESVELVKGAHKRSAAGLVNAVLRKIERASSDLNDGLAHPDWLVDRWTRIYGPDAACKICEYDQSGPRSAIRLNIAQSNVETAVPGCPRAAGPRLRMQENTGRGKSRAALDGQPGTAVPTLFPDGLRDEGIQLEPGKLLSSAFTVKSGDITATKAFRERRATPPGGASQTGRAVGGEGTKILGWCAGAGGANGNSAGREPRGMGVAV